MKFPAPYGIVLRKFSTCHIFFLIFAHRQNIHNFIFPHGHLIYHKVWLRPGNNWRSILLQLMLPLGRMLTELNWERIGTPAKFTIKRLSLQTIMHVIPPPTQLSACIYDGKFTTPARQTTTNAPTCTRLAFVIAWLTYQPLMTRIRINSNTSVKRTGRYYRGTSRFGRTCIRDTQFARKSWKH